MTYLYKHRVPSTDKDFDKWKRLSEYCLRFNTQPSLMHKGKEVGFVESWPIVLPEVLEGSAVDFHVKVQEREGSDLKATLQGDPGQVAFHIGGVEDRVCVFAHIDEKRRTQVLLELLASFMIKGARVEDGVLIKGYQQQELIAVLQRLRHGRV